MLTPKQSRFVDEYMIDLNATQASIRAGYSRNGADVQGVRLLGNASVKAALQERMAARSQRTEITQDYVLTTIKDTVERCRQAKPVLRSDGTPVLAELEDGTEAPMYEFDAPAVLRGCELLGKHLKLFTDKVEHSGDDPTTRPNVTVLFIEPSGKKVNTEGKK